MATTGKKTQHWLSGLLGALLVLGLTLVGFFSPVGNFLDSLSYDFPYAFRSGRPGNDVVIVYLDDASHQDLDQPFNAPWNRSLHARLINTLVTNQAKAIVFDILLTDANTNNPSADQQFKEALQSAKRVVLAADYILVDVHGQEAETLALPYDPFAKAAAGWGNAKLLYDYDLAVRRHFPNLPGAGGFESLPSLAWAAATLAGAPITKARPTPTSARWINYYGPPGFLPGISYYQVLLPQNLHPFPADFFRDKVVFVGSKPSPGFSGAARDEFATPHSRWGRGFSSGVEIHATAFLNLMRGDWLTRPPQWVELAMLILTSVLLGCGLASLRPIPAFGVAVGALALTAGLDLFLVWSAKIWFSWLFVGAIQIPAALVWSWLTNFFHWSVERSLLVESLSAHVPPARVKELLRQPDLLKPGGTKRTVSVLFTDISNYSAIIEGMPLPDLVKMLNGYFEATLGAIHENDGTIIKLIGDAIFAVWNAPQDQATHQELACAAALRLRDHLVRFDASSQAEPLRTRVGLHSGEALVGNFGSQRRFDYTAMGENVNLASRLEGLNKHLGTDILASREFQQVIENKFVDRPLGKFRVKGFGRPVEIHEIVGTLDCRETTRPWRETFASGLHKFKRKDFAGAEESFRQVLSLKPNDGPSRFYLKLLAEFHDTPPGNDWVGIVEIKEK